MSYDFSETKLIQESAGNLLSQELGWHVVYAYNQEKLGSEGTLGRISYKEILLTRYLKKSIKKLNPWITDELIDDVIKKFESYMSTSSLLQINEEKYRQIINGIKVNLKRPDGTDEVKTVILIDFDDPENNDFFAVEEMKIYGDLYHRRTDIVGFVNGIPLLFIEFKRNDVDVENAYIDNYRDYQRTIPKLFHYNAMVILSNGDEAKVGTLGSPYEFFHDWKRLAEEDEGSVELQTMLRGICKKENFLDIIENFILFDHSGGKTNKILARNHQYLGVNEAMRAYSNRKVREGKLGVFWHTQGSGKSYSMLFLTQKIKRKFAGSPTFVILTDRDDLNTQISDTFENCGLLGSVKASEFIASSGKDLVKKLKGNPSYIFTLIQKFNQPVKEPIKPDHDIIIISDEAHRSQYGVYANNMMDLLPTASRIGFTGTPLLSEDNITARTFGGYISIYDFKRAVEDNATVPLFYENRGEKIQDLKNPQITEEILDAIEEADLDPDKQDKVEAEFAKEIHLYTAEPRLRLIAKDFVKNYSDMWKSGKAMFVSINKVTCVRMYNLVQEYWEEEIGRLKSLLSTLSGDEYDDLQDKIKWMEETEMAVVISQEQNEISTFEKWGLDILPHRAKMMNRELDKEFKDRDNPFRVVFVCAMWLTGFDVKPLSCLYLDKPLKAHTLMQAIARANRVDKGKSNGMIIDYVGIVKALRKALADYTANVGHKGGVDPTIDKKVLIAKILQTIKDAKSFLKDKGFDLQELIDAKNFDKLALVNKGANSVCSPVEDRKIFTTYSSEIITLMKYADREDISKETRKESDAITAIHSALMRKRSHTDITDLMVKINGIISENIEIEEGTELNYDTETKKFDISEINFDLLSKEFERVKNKKLVIRDLQDVIEFKLDNMLKVNSNRIDYYKRYQKIIEEYNKKQDKSEIERTFEELMKFAKSLDDEQQRYIKEGFKNEQEQALYEIVFKDDLSKAEIKQVKELSAELLEELKAKVAELDHWRDKEQTQAEVSNLIRNILWSKLPDSYDSDSFAKLNREIYEYAWVSLGEAA
ncbi:MAG: type I restriction endonuclease subunit R [Coriobacteriia bacterium]|nr:type I restriction endonuclease subunit R [Coriobacteriia bacterium]